LIIISIYYNLHLVLSYNQVCLWILILNGGFIMKIKNVELVEGKILLKCEDSEFYLKDGVYQRDNGETITVRNNQIVDVLIHLDPANASKRQLKSYLEDMENQLQRVGNDAQLANIDLQNMLQKQQQAIQMMSNISKSLHDTAKTIIQKIG